MTVSEHSSVKPITSAMRALLTPEILAEIGSAMKAVKIDRTFEVPGVANRSKDGKTVYIDDHLPIRIKDGTGKAFDPSQTLAWHEISEFVLMNHGADYLDAHALATEEFEKPHVEAMGLTWPKYQEAMGGEIAANEARNVKEPPPNIDKRPFEHGMDEKHLKEVDADEKYHAPVQNGQNVQSVQARGFRLVPVDHDPFAQGTAS